MSTALSFVTFVHRMIYGLDTGTVSEAVITPNHRNWLLQNTSPTGQQWLDHHLDVMLPVFESWLVDNGLPPLTAWDGTRVQRGDGSVVNVTMNADLDTLSAVISSEEILGQRLRTHAQAAFTQCGEIGRGGGNFITASAAEVSAWEKAPTSWRFWSYLKWAQIKRAQYRGEPVVIPSELVDFDGTPLSARPFFDVYNQAHFAWHGAGTLANQSSPGWRTSVGQFRRRTNTNPNPINPLKPGQAGPPVGLSPMEEFLVFHREHYDLVQRWFARRNEAPVRGFMMTDQSTRAGLPGNNFIAGTNPPAMRTPADWAAGTWTGVANEPTQLVTSGLSARATLGQISNAAMGPHGAGHLDNSDIADIYDNNYSPRFYSWHRWLDNQWSFRSPRFALWNATTHDWDVTFRPVLISGAQAGHPFPGVQAITHVHDGTTSSVSPSGALSGWHAGTGAGTLRFELLAAHPFNYPGLTAVTPLKLSVLLVAEVFDDTVSTTNPVETVALPTIICSSAPTGAERPLDTPFTVDFTFATGLAATTLPGSGGGVSWTTHTFENTRVRVTGWVMVADASDANAANFEYAQHIDIQLTRDVEPPELTAYYPSKISDAEVNSLMGSGTQAVFSHSVLLEVQDRGGPAHIPTFPAGTFTELEGLIMGRAPVSGLFESAAQAPSVQLLDSGGAPFSGVSVALASGPDKEDPGLAENLPQRFTYRYDIVFSQGHNAFAGLSTGQTRAAILRVEGRDRAGNLARLDRPVTLVARAANPYFVDVENGQGRGWLSNDTRVFTIEEGQTKFGVTLGVGGDPVLFIQGVIAALRAGNGTAGGDSFQGLPSAQGGSSLTYSTTRNGNKVYNFALARARIQAAAPVADVRVVFRLFSYTSTRLKFDADRGYRSAGGVGLLGYEAPASGSVISVPFFASPRVGVGSSTTRGLALTTQADPHNLYSFPSSASAAERVSFFGAWLDINQDSARIPGNLITGLADGGFLSTEVYPIRDVIKGAHQCMVAEIVFAGDPSIPGKSPSQIDNLAQRNLAIAQAQNPGVADTRTVEHSFNIDARPEAPRRVPLATVAERRRMLDVELHRVMDMAPAKLEVAPRRLAMHALDEQELALAPALAPWSASALPFSAHAWAHPQDDVDELMIEWNDLPKGTAAQLYLPTISAVDVMNLRNLRHAPSDVRLVDNHTLALTVGTPTYIPIPHTEQRQLPASLRLTLPEGIRAGQSWPVDVVQLHGREEDVVGGFTLRVDAAHAADMFEADRELLGLLHKRGSHVLDVHDPWRSVLEQRIAVQQTRVHGLYTALRETEPELVEKLDIERVLARPAGREIRVVVEHLELRNETAVFHEGKAEVYLQAHVATRREDDGQATRAPAKGSVRVRRPEGEWAPVEVEVELFRGWVDDFLAIEILAMEDDRSNPDDHLGRYVRVFDCDVSEMLGHHAPKGRRFELEDTGLWRIAYRVELV